MTDRRCEAGPRHGVAAVMALKPLSAAKSRLDLAPALRARLALTMFADTLTAVLGVVEQAVVVSAEPALQSRLERMGLAAEVVAEDPGGTGLNTALRQGAAHAHSAGSSRILACLGDLPALQPTDVDTVLAAAAGRRRSFVADASRVGTTMLIADADAFEPHFQGRSADAHQRAGADPLGDDDLGGPLPRARRDVDTENDLVEAVDLGLGAWTSSLIDPHTRRLGSLDVVTVTSARAMRTQQDRADPVSAQRLQVITSTGHRIGLDASDVHDHDRGRSVTLRPGQRLHAVSDGDRVLSAWW